jgi:1,4-dihydroxy-2-naphthoate polyprenyltransferase
MKLTFWIEALRPQTLSASISPVLLGTFLAGSNFSVIIALLTMLTAIGIQVGTNFANDYFDFIKGSDSSKRIGPRRMVQSGLITPSSMKTAIFFTFGTTAFFSLYLIAVGGPIITCFVIVAIALGLLYTAGPYPLAHLGLGDLFVLIFFGPVATGATFYLQANHLNLPSCILGLCPGLLSTAILTTNNLRDRHEDLQTHKKTLCVRFGKLFGQIEYTITILLALCIPCFFNYYLPLFIIIPAIIPLKTIWKNNNEHLLNITLAQTGKLLIFFSILLIVNIKLLG